MTVRNCDTGVIVDGICLCLPGWDAVSRMTATGHLQPASSLSPGGRLPDAYQPFIVGFSEITILNDCSHREQSFKRQNQLDREGREAANSGHNRLWPAGNFDEGWRNKKVSVLIPWGPIHRAVLIPRIINSSLLLNL